MAHNFNIENFVHRNIGLKYETRLKIIELARNLKDYDAVEIRQWLCDCLAEEIVKQENEEV